MTIPFPIKTHCSLPNKGHFRFTMDFAKGLFYINMHSPSFSLYLKFKKRAYFASVISDTVTLLCFASGHETQTELPH